MAYSRSNLTLPGIGPEILLLWHGGKNCTEQESIPVGCVLHAPTVHASPIDVSTSGWVGS